jgi:hypothetical protein
MTLLGEMVRGNSFDGFLKEDNVPMYQGEINKWNQPL